MGVVFRAEFGNLLGSDAANASRPSQKTARPQPTSMALNRRTVHQRTVTQN